MIAYVLDCSPIDKVNLKMTIVKPRMKVVLYFGMYPCSGSFALLLQFCHLDCIFYDCVYFSFVGKVKLKQISCFSLISHQQYLSLLWSATGIRN